MKKILLLCFFSLAFISLGVAQTLQYTKWEKYDTYFSDTLIMKFRNGTYTANIRTCTVVSGIYTEKDNIITFQDFSGSNACPSIQIGTYRLARFNGDLHFTLVNDLCPRRENSLNGSNWKRVPGEMIHVPNDYPTIARGIDAAFNLDTVLVDTGTYYENINFMGKKPLTVASRFILDGDTNHIANTIINGSQALDPDRGTVVTFESGEDTTSVLCGFTVTGGVGTIIPATNFRAGGGVFIMSAGCKLQNNYIQYNEMMGDYFTLGGGICAGGELTVLPWVVLRNNRINYNKAISHFDQGSGGGIEIYYPLIMVDNQISWNVAKGVRFAIGGGARLLTNFGPITIDIRNNLITNNKAESNSKNTILVHSGGVNMNSKISGLFSNNIVSDNENVMTDGKWSWGPGILVDFVNTGDLLVENNHIMNNYFTGGFCIGGGLSIYNSKGIFQNNVIMGNSGTHGGGIGIQDNFAFTTVFINNTVTSNTASFLGGGMYLENANAKFINSIIWGNTAPEENSIYLEASALEVYYSDVEGSRLWPGDGNILCNPQFTGDGYHLKYTCMLLDKGISTIYIGGVKYNCPIYDIDGDLRPFAGGSPEIGADELRIAFPRGELIPGQSLSIYPNPASGKITVEPVNRFFELNSFISVSDITGKELILKKVTGSKTEIDVSSLPAGVYFIKLIATENMPTAIAKFVKK